MKELLLPFAQVVDRKWTLKKEPDLDFIREFQKINEGYLKTWTANRAKLLQDSLAQLDISHSDKNDKHGNIKGMLLFTQVNRF